MEPTQPKIQKNANVLKTEITFNFEDTDGNMHEAIVLRNKEDPGYWKVTVDEVEFTESKTLDNFLFCEKDSNGTVEIGKVKYTCHEIKAASEGALILGNRICPLVINPPGIVINL